MYQIYNAEAAPLVEGGRRGFEGLEKKTERDKDNLSLSAPLDSLGPKAVVESIPLQFQFSL